MTAPVIFPLAKLLNSIGFDKYCSSGYTETGDKYLHQGGQEPVRNGQSYYEGRDYIGGEFYCSAPTIAEVVMWLYEKHEIWITVWTAYNNSYKFSYGVVYRKNIVVFHETNFDEKDSPREAYEAAIEYCLTKLI